MLTQLPEEKKSSIINLFKNKQPNGSALSCYFEGKLPGKTFVDNIGKPTKAICKLDMSWTYASDESDFDWIEDSVHEIIKNDWVQLIWMSSRRPRYPLKGFGKIIPRLEYVERKSPQKKSRKIEASPFASELFDKLETDYKNWHISSYGSKDEFLKNTFGFYALENGEICCECEAAFISNGYCEIGVYTFEKYRRQGYAFATCLHTLDELTKKGLKAIWSCDCENRESSELAEKLGFVNPLEYDFIYFPQQAGN